jgi:hypothetical protein
MKNASKELSVIIRQCARISIETHQIGVGTSLIRYYVVKF